MNNAPYRSVQRDKAPTTANRKDEIISWLHGKCVDADLSMLNVELLRLVGLHKPRTPTYILDELARESGHVVIRLSPYHCKYNAIEMVWAQVKGHAAKHNTVSPFTATKMLTLLMDACDNVTAKNWKDVERIVIM